MSDGPPHLVRLIFPHREKAKRQLIPSSANDDTDTRARGPQIKRREREGSFFQGYEANRVSPIRLVGCLGRGEEGRVCGKRMIAASSAYSSLLSPVAQKTPQVISNYQGRFLSNWTLETDGQSRMGTGE